MSVLVKGMKMPRDDCEALRQITITNAWVDGEIKMLAHDTVTNEFIGEVVDVHTPHGRLNDADYLKEHIIACATNGRPLHNMELSELLEAIDDVPAVIEAEEC